MSDTLSVLIWWFTFFVIGIAVYPLTKKIFGRFIDQGYIFTKVIGMLVISYIVWLLGSFKILPFYKETVLLVLIAIASINLYFYLNQKNQEQNTDKPKGIFATLVILEELLFLGTLSFWAYVRSAEPSIRSLEKFMDFGFVGSILRSAYFPPLDMWLTHAPDYQGGYFINYYYFGHLITAVLTKLSGLNSIISYNLAIAVLFAFTFTLSFSLGMNLFYFFLKSLSSQIKTINYKLLIVAGFLTAFLISLGGNLHTIYAFTTGYPNDRPVPFWQLPLGWHPETYWYPNATRFIPFTIHEFPLYSFVVADLHGHVSDIPFVLLTLALLFNLLLKETSGNNAKTDDARETWNKTRLQKLGWLNDFLQEFKDRTTVSFPYLILLSLLMAVMYMTNAVDGLIYMMLTGLVILYRNWKYTNNISSTITRTFSASLFILFFFLIAGLPFSINFKPFGTGIGVLCAPAVLLGKKIGPFFFEEGKCQKSPLFMLAILWGFFYYNVIGFILLILVPYIKRLKAKLAGDASEGSHDESSPSKRRRQNGDYQNYIAQDLKRGMGHASGRTRENGLFITDIFVTLTTIISTLLLIFPEYFYIKDIYPLHYRANTMFKFGYQAFIMLGLDSAYIFLRIKMLPWSIKRLCYILGFIVVFFFVAIYPFFAINSYYSGLKVSYGLDGSQWLKKEYPNDYDAIIWLRNNIVNQPTILEANGDSYTDYDRVSAYTGLPTVIGWPVHEWLWRGSFEEPGKRIPLVQELYESSDLNLTKQLIQKYNISYVFIGTLERVKYPKLNENKWNNLGKLVFQSGNTKIYKLNSL